MKRIRRILLILFAFILIQNVFGVRVLRAEDEVEIAANLPLSLEADLAIVVDAATGRIIYSRGSPHQAAFPASMTKIMTALLLLESGADMNDRIFHSYEAVFSIPRNSSHIYMSPGESLTVSQALHAIMLPSANDVSNAIAEFVAGDMETFAEMMTARARQLGALNTNFTNAHGLPDPALYTTPYDMTLIMRELIKHEKFLQVAATPRFIIPPREVQTNPLAVDNTNLMVRPTSPHFSLDVVGGKTGWTTPSGHTLVSYGRRGDVGLITVVMAAARRDIIFNDTQTLMNFAFEQFESHKLFNSENFDKAVELVQRSGQGAVVVGHLPLVADRNAEIWLPAGLNPEYINKQFILPNRITAPIAENAPVGRLVLSYNNHILDEVAVRTAAAAPSRPLTQASSSSGGSSTGMTTLLPSYYGQSLLPSWLTTPNLLAMSLAVVAAVILLMLAIKFLKFNKYKKRRGSFKSYSSKSFKTHISKNYRYR